MTHFELQTAYHTDGSAFRCFETLNVIVARRVIGMIQCVGPCTGLGGYRIPGHQHGPWIAFAGPDADKALNISTSPHHPTQQSAVDAIIAHVAEQAGQ